MTPTQYGAAGAITHPHHQCPAWGLRLLLTTRCACYSSCPAHVFWSEKQVLNCASSQECMSQTACKCCTSIPHTAMHVSFLLHCMRSQVCCLSPAAAHPPPFLLGGRLVILQGRLEGCVLRCADQPKPTKTPAACRSTCCTPPPTCSSTTTAKWTQARLGKECT